MVFGFDLVSRSGRDLVADRMLANLVRYMAGAEPHEATQEVTERIVWGNYATERGIVTSPRPRGGRDRRVGRDEVTAALGSESRRAGSEWAGE